MNINYDSPFNFKPIPTITPASDYWQNSTWGFNMPEITPDTAYAPSFIDVILKGNTALTLVNAKEDGLNYLKLFGGTEQRNLPSGYTQVISVKNTLSDYTSYLDTGIIADVDDIEYDVVALINDNNPVSWYILQSRVGNPIYGISGSSNGNDIRGSFCGTNVIATSIVRQENHTYHVNFKCQNGTATLFVEDLTDGTSETQTDIYTFEATTKNTGLFSNLYIPQGTNTPQLVSAENTSVLSAYIKKSGVKVMEYIPCKNSNNEAGFYDRVSKSFKGAKVGTFTAGADVTTPSPTTPIDIVCNNGAIKVSPNLWNPSTVTYTEGALAAVSGQPAISAISHYTSAIPVKPNTTYTLSFMDEVDPPPGQTLKRVHGYSTTNIVDWVEQLAYEQFTQGDYCTLTFTTPATVNYIRLSCGLGDYDFQLEQGSTATPYRPYGQIYVDGTTETVEVTGKNLFDKNGSTYGYYLDSNGVSQPSEYEGFTFAYTDYIPVKPSTTYTLAATSVITSLSNHRIFGYDENKNFLGQESNLVLPASTLGTRGSQTFTTGADTKFLRINYIYIPNGENQQLELGSTATDYEPYTVLGTATAEMLLAIGDYQDEQSVIDGEVTRKVGIKALDGTENWFYNLPLADMFCLLGFATARIDDRSAPCTHFKTSTSVPTSGTRDGYCVRSSEGTIGIGYNKMNGNVTAFKQWLSDQYNSGNPVVIVYPLATATTETVTGQPLTIQEGTNIVEITQASMDNLELEVSYKAGVEVTITEVENAQLDNNVEVTIQ